MRPQLALACALALLVVACGDEAETTTTTAGSGATGAGGGGAAGSGAGAGPDTQSFTVEFGPVTVEPGSEDTKCVTKLLGNDEPIIVGRIRNEIPIGSHHLIVYRVNDTEERTEPDPCQPFTDALDPEQGSPLMVTQKHDETLVLPQGVGFSLGAGQMVRLEVHYLNTAGAPIEVTSKSTFTTMAPGEFEHEADFLFIGSPDIDIPPLSEATLGPVYFDPPAKLDGVSYFGITGHTHQYGTSVDVSIAETESGPDTPVYDVEEWQWSEPETVYHDPPFQVPVGGGFRFSCAWNNTSEQTVGFGESANEEMCFFWTYYYPSQGAYVCFHTDQYMGGYDLCCPGDAACSFLQ